MAESSIFWTTNGTGDGTGSGYTMAQLFQFMRSFARTSNLGGVFPDVLNELAVSGAATPVAVNTGQAICYGIVYFNSASVNVAISTPAALTRIDRIVLRASWAAQTVRITRIAGTEGGAAPAITQTPLTTYDIPLAQVSITTGGVITVTDEREWALGEGDNTVDNTKLSQGTAGTMKGNFTGSTANLTDTSVATVLAQYVHAATEKTTPVAADEFLLIDSAASNVLKKATLTDLISVLASVGLVTVSTFTPAVYINSSATGITYTTQTGVYAQIGRLVFYAIKIVLLSKGASTGNVEIRGFPATVSATGQYNADVYFLGIAANASGMKIRMTNSNTTGFLYYLSDPSATNPFTNLTNSIINNNVTLELTGFYITT